MDQGAGSVSRLILIVNALRIAGGAAHSRPCPGEIIEVLVPAPAGIVNNNRGLMIESGDAGEIKQLRLPAAVGIIFAGDKDTVGRFHVKASNNVRTPGSPSVEARDSMLLRALRGKNCHDHLPLAATVKLTKKYSLPASQ